jgi:hypothetical protein
MRVYSVLGVGVFCNGGILALPDTKIKKAKKKPSPPLLWGGTIRVTIILWRYWRGKVWVLVTKGPPENLGLAKPTASSSAYSG